jgi:transcription initiation factor TFIIF subunit beta
MESIPDVNIKPEPMDEDTPSPYVDEDDDMYEDAGDLDFSQSQQQLWLSHIPRTLWETLSKLQDDDEMEIGTIRVEGPESNPSRVRKIHLRIYTVGSEITELDLSTPRDAMLTRTSSLCRSVSCSNR